MPCRVLQYREGWGNWSVEFINLLLYTGHLRDAAPPLSIMTGTTRVVQKSSQCFQHPCWEEGFSNSKFLYWRITVWYIATVSVEHVASILMVENPKKNVGTYQSAWDHIPRDYHLNTHCCVDLRSWNKTRNILLKWNIITAMYKYMRNVSPCVCMYVN
jgi:hypothetical protein